MAGTKRPTPRSKGRRGLLTVVMVLVAAATVGAARAATVISETTWGGVNSVRSRSLPVASIWRSLSARRVSLRPCISTVSPRRASSSESPSPSVTQPQDRHFDPGEIRRAFRAVLGRGSARGSARKRHRHARRPGRNRRDAERHLAGRRRLRRRARQDRAIGGHSGTAGAGARRPPSGQLIVYRLFFEPGVADLAGRSSLPVGAPLGHAVGRGDLLCGAAVAAHHEQLLVGAVGRPGEGDQPTVGRDGGVAAVGA